MIENAVFEGHCGYLPRAHLGPMINVQIARDLTLAAAITDAVGHSGGQNGAVLIAGSQHVRRDAGVPVHLARMLPEASILVIGFVEIAKDKTAEPFNAGELAKTGAHDILVFTDPGPDKDYCADLAKRFGLKDKPVHAKPKSD